MGAGVLQQKVFFSSLESASSGAPNRRHMPCFGRIFFFRKQHYFKKGKQRYSAQLCFQKKKEKHSPASVEAQSRLLEREKHPLVKRKNHSMYFGEKHNLASVGSTIT